MGDAPIALPARVCKKWSRARESERTGETCDTCGHCAGKAARSGTKVGNARRSIIPATLAYHCALQGFFNIGVVVAVFLGACPTARNRRKLIHVCCLIAGVARCSIPMASHCRGCLEFATLRKRRKQHWRGAQGNTVRANLNLVARACPQNWNQIWCAKRVHKFVPAVMCTSEQLAARMGTDFGTQNGNRFR